MILFSFYKLDAALFLSASVQLFLLTRFLLVVPEFNSSVHELYTDRYTSCKACSYLQKRTNVVDVYVRITGKDTTEVKKKKVNMSGVICPAQPSTLYPTVIARMCDCLSESSTVGRLSASVVSKATR